MSTRRRTHLLLIAGSLGASLLLAGCGPTAPEDPEAAPSASDTPSASPSATEEPQAPELGDLVITANGMGTLVIGEAPSTDPLKQMIEEDPSACADINTGMGSGIEPGDPEALRWVPVDRYETGGFAPWSVNVLSGNLARIDVRDDSIPTDEGIRIGDSREAALAAYPDATIVDQDITDVLVVSGEHGVMHIEIAKEDGDFAGYWEGQVDTVVFLRAVELSSPVYTVAASENIAGGCL